jgi:hypothetical protein
MILGISRELFEIGDDANGIPSGCGSFAIEAKAQSFKQIDGVLSLPAARIRGDIDTPAGYLLHPR